MAVVIAAVTGTLAVAVFWLCAGTLIAACGSLTRRALLRVLSIPTGGVVRRADMWIGLAFVLIFLQVWSLFAAVDVAPAVVLGAVGLAGIASWLTARWRFRPRRQSLGVTALTSLGVLWFANRALAVPTDYDLGLYHASAIAYASHFATIPGLGNLQNRLGAGNGHFLLVAALGRWPWSDAGFRLGNGLLGAFLCVDIASRFRRGAGSERDPSFTRRMALLLVPAALVASFSSNGTEFRLSSPNLDFAAFVLVAVGSLYLAECVEGTVEPVAALASTSALALAAVTRPLYWPATVLAALVILVMLGRRAPGRNRGVQLAALTGTLPFALLAGWASRQAVLSGYPFFPSTIVGLPVDWRVPASAVHHMNRVVMAWARWPRKNPTEVLASWDWLHVWLRSTLTNPDVLAPLLLLMCLLPALGLRSSSDAARRKAWLAPLSGVLLLSVPILVAWFLFAPDPRFVLAPLWLVPIGLVAWALPTRADSGSKRARKNLLVYGTLGFLAVFVVAVDAKQGAFRPIVPHGKGPFRTYKLGTPPIRAFETTSGLRLWRPTHGDRCWSASLCTPQPNKHLSLRNTTGISHGFHIGAVTSPKSSTAATARLERLVAPHLR